MCMKAENRRRPPRKRRRTYGSHGIITVFVTLIMIPVVAITSLMVDLARLKLYSSQAVMAADSYGSAVLSEFDNLLKQLYGLFSVTQDEEGLAAVEKLAEYAGYSFDPSGGGMEADGFMPYKDADVEMEWEKVEGASLSNNNVLMTQISDFMKYRIVEEVLEEGGLLDFLGEFESYEADTKAVEKRKEITESSTEALEVINSYYEELRKLAAYPDYLDAREKAFLDYSEELEDVADSDEYEDYVYYLEHEDEIQDAIEAFEESEDGEDLGDASELYDKYADYDPDEYIEDLEEIFSELSDDANENDSDPVDFDNVDGIIDNLGIHTEKLESVMGELKEQVAELKNSLSDCSEDLREGIEKEIRDIDEILSLAGEFRRTYELLIENDCKGLNAGNKSFMETYVPELDDKKDDLLDGEIEPGDDDWPHTTSLAWYDFRDDAGSFYSVLQRLCGSGGSGGDEKAGEKEIDRADAAKEEALETLRREESTSARDIPSGIQSELGTGGGAAGSVPDIGDCFIGGLSFDALSAAGSHILDKFLVTTYDFGMFSSRVSGIRPEEENEDGTVPGESEEAYSDYSLTGIEMSKDVNYLYGAELEYLFGGHGSSKSNLNETRNVICGVRMALNFASTYSIEEINSAINAIADAAAAAVASSGVGAGAAPLVRLAVSGALRLAVASIETAADWTELTARKTVVLYKSELGDLQSAEAVSSLLGLEIREGSGKDKFGLSYEDYLYLLLFLFQDDNTLLSRTSDLITLNVNQAKEGGDSLSSLDFKMEDTVTAVKSTCKVKADFVVLPEYIAEWYYANTDTASVIEVLEDHYFGYSVIRGY